VTDLDKALALAKDVQDQLNAKGIDPSAVAKQARTVEEHSKKLESLGVSREKVMEIIDANQAAEPPPPILVEQPTLAEVIAKLDEILARLGGIEARLAS